MLKLNASAFYEAVTAMQHTETAIEGKESTFTHPDGSVEITPITDEVFLNVILKRLIVLLKALKILGARLTIMEVERFHAQLWSGSITYEALRNYSRSVSARLTDELSLAHVFVLEADKFQFFDPSQPLFGADVQTKLPSATFEIDEAGKCFALGRPTATVFHLMRVMEIGIRALARCLQIPAPIKPAERNWGNILKKVWDEGIVKKWPLTSDRLSGDGALFESLHATLDAVKNPWRNATMHVENVYTDDEAEHLIAAVKGFMKKLASRMDEQGVPLA